MKLRSDRKIELLRSVPMFSACSERQLAKIASLADRIDAPQGDVVVREGAPGREFFVIVDGTAKVTLRGRKLASLGPSDFFGEMALLDQGPRAATVVAETPLTLLVVDARDFGELLEEVPAITKKVMRGMAQRLRAIQPSAAH